MSEQLRENRLSTSRYGAPRGALNTSIISAWLLMLSKGLFCLLYLLVLGSPFWYVGVFTWWPLGQVSFNGMAVPVGVAAVLPLAVLALWLGGRLLDRSRRWRWGPAWVTGPLLALATLTLLGLKEDQGGGARSVIGVGALLLPLLYLYFVNELRGPHLLAWLFLAILIPQALVALGQFAAQSEVGLAFLGEPRLDARQPGISVVLAGGVRWLRAYGLTAHPNILGGYLALGLLLLVGLHLSSRGWWREILLLPFGLGLTALLASFSRSAWLAFAAGLTLMLILLMGTRISRAQHGPALLKFALLSLVIVLAYATAYRSLFITRLARPDNPLEARSISDRVRDTRLALAVIRAEPLSGAGSGNYLRAAQRLARNGRERQAARTVHNLPLLITAELGPLGGGLWVWLSLLWAVVLWQHRQGLWRRSMGQESAEETVGVGAWLACAAASLLALAIIASFDNYPWISIHWQAAFLLAAVFGLGATVLE